MLNCPDIQASAHINHWINVILMFDFELQHVPGEKHKGPVPCQGEYQRRELRVLLDDMTLMAQRGRPKKKRRGVAIAAIMKDLEEELAQIMKFLVTLKPPEGLSKIHLQAPPSQGDISNVCKKVCYYFSQTTDKQVPSRLPGVAMGWGRL